MDLSNKIIKQTVAAVLLLLCAQPVFAQKVVHYDLYVTDTTVNFAGKEKHAIAVNGQIPMPTLEFTQGDTAEIVVHNRLKESTSLHWHGLWLPNKMDGVPWVTQKPIAPGDTYTYRFPIIQHGTHWYHSHSGMQEQLGMYGVFIMHKRKNDPAFRKGIDDLPTIPVILSEWTNRNPKNVMRTLHTGSDNDWGEIKKGSTQSYWEAVKKGYFGVKLTNEWKRMQAMDVSDVYYNAFLLNGKIQSQLSQFKAGDKVRLRIANGGSSDYFWLTYAGGKVMVVANDGNDVEPVKVDRLIIGVAETYDIVVTIPNKNTSYDLLATPEDRSGSASLFLGSGLKQLANRMPQLKYFEGMKMMNDMMTMGGNMKDMGMNMSLQQMDMNNVMYPEITGYNDKEKDNKSQMDMPMNMGNKSENNEHGAHSMKNEDIVTLNYAMLKSPTKTNFPKDTPIKAINLTLTGNMRRYVWSFNGKVLSEVDKIPVKKGQVLRLVLHNNSMMRHPIHLHGFDFRLLNGKGDYAPMKNTVDILPMETDTLVFKANREGDWFFHCHILYHMMSGMARVFDVGNYDNPNFKNDQKAYKKLQRNNDKFHFMIENDFATNGNDGQAMLANTRWQLGTEWRLGYNDMHGYETETHLGRYIGKGQFFMPFVGFDWRYRKMGHNEYEKNLFGQKDTKDNRMVFSLGFEYLLPMLITFQTEVFHDGNVRLQLSREDIPISPRVRMGFMVNTDKEYMVGLSYILTRYMRIRTHYDSDMGLGVGLSLNY